MKIKFKIFTLLCLQFTIANSMFRHVARALIVNRTYFKSARLFTTDKKTLPKVIYLPKKLYKMDDNGGCYLTDTVINISTYVKEHNLVEAFQAHVDGQGVELVLVDDNGVPEPEETKVPIR